MSTPDAPAGDLALAGPRTVARTSYAAAGVDIDAGDRAVELMKRHVGRASRSEVIGGLGGFAGLFALPPRRYAEPVLASSTDGVGTKVAIAQALDRHDTIGRDLVAMVVDDLVVCGAEPLFLQDYIACGHVVPERQAAIVSGIADGCVLAGCALVGGETAEHPGLMGADDYDVAGTGVGVVERAKLLGPELVRAGDAVVALGSTGLHANGYSLARHALLELGGLRLDEDVGVLGRTLGEELLEPTRIYALDALALLDAVPVHAMAHVTGGGLSANLARVLPAGLDAVVDATTWRPQPIFDLIASLGGVDPVEMERTFNLGVGMVAVLPPAAADAAIAVLTERGVPAWIAGEIRVQASNSPTE